MRFDLVDLQLFLAIAEARSITGGADRAHLALASASARIKGLEAALGRALLKRGRRGIELTAAGESLLDHARIILHNVEAMRGDLSAYAGGMKATIRLLTNTSGLSEYLPKALAAFLGQHPHISIDVEERESAEIAQAIVTARAGPDGVDGTGDDTPFRSVAELARVPGMNPKSKGKALPTCSGCPRGFR